MKKNNHKTRSQILPSKFTATAQLRELLVSLSTVLDIRLFFRDVDGHVITFGKYDYVSAFCGHVRRVKGLQACQQSDQELLTKAECSREIILHHCHAGLCDGAVPVMNKDKRLGLLAFGQFRMDRRTPPFQYLSASESGALASEWNALPLFEGERYDELCNLMRQVAVWIGAADIIQLQRGPVVEKILAWIKTNPAAGMSLSDAAKHTGVSTSTITHQFRKETGFSFRQACTELKVTMAEHSLTREPSLSIRELSERFGFDDAAYFSRVFRRHRGYAPHEGRQKK